MHTQHADNLRGDNNEVVMTSATTGPAHTHAHSHRLNFRPHLRTPGRDCDASAALDDLIFETVRKRPATDTHTLTAAAAAELMT